MPVGAGYYDGELIQDWPGCLSAEERLELIETHRLFTGCCPERGATYPENPVVHWNCPDPSCNWLDDYDRVNDRPTQARAGAANLPRSNLVSFPINVPLECPLQWGQNVANICQGLLDKPIGVSQR